jgi:hypothetical protein
MIFVKHDNSSEKHKEKAKSLGYEKIKIFFILNVILPRNLILAKIINMNMIGMIRKSSFVPCNKDGGKTRPRLGQLAKVGVRRV